MAKSTYSEQVNKLSEVIDIAIEAIKKFPPKELQDDNIDKFVNGYLNFKNRALNPEPEYKNSRSLKYVINDVFTYFQEDSGEAVNYFWKKIYERQLGYKRDNKLLKILKRKKIKDDIEYDLIIDILGPYTQQGLLSEEELTEINKLIVQFESRPSR